MTEREMKALFLSLVKIYFGGAEVIWGRAKTVHPKHPLVTLIAGPLARNYLPVTLDAGGIPINCYPTKVTVQIDLFTKGAALSDDAGATGAAGATGVTAARENTAVDDMMDFLNFIGSQYVTDWCYKKDMAILENGPVRDLTQIINDTSWDYRAMAELDVYFTQNAVGYTGTDHELGVEYDTDGNPKPPSEDFKETPSGGRTPELADEFTGWYEQVETTDEGDNNQ